MHNTFSADRQRTWYRSWIFGEEAPVTRRNIAASILVDIKEHNYSPQTIVEFTRLLNHELLCHCAEQSRSPDNYRANSASSITRPFPDFHRASSNSLSSPESSSPISPESSRSSSTNGLSVYLEPSLSRNLVEGAIEELSKCLIQSNNANAPAEREIQYRALFSALILLRAHGVESLECDFYDRVFNNLKLRFRDLHWVPGDSGELSAQKYYKLQSAYLLSAAVEFASNFSRAKPWIVEMTSRLTSLLSFGAAVATTGTGTGGMNLAVTIKHLENAFKSISHSAQEQYAPLFSLQALVNVFHSINLLTLVAEDRPIAYIQHTEELSKAAREIDGVVMNQVAKSLKENNEGAGIKLPRFQWEHILVSVSRGPPGFSKYHFLYGLMDQAAQMSRANRANPCPLSSDIQTILANIAIKREEPSFRWKALACLSEANDPTRPLSQAKSILQSAQCQERSKHQSEETKLCNILEVNPILDQRAASSLSTPSTKSSLLPAMSPEDWQEPHFHPPKLSQDCRRLSLGSNVSTDGSAALSPDCSYALLRDDKYVQLFNVESEQGRPELIFKQKKGGHPFRDARLSARYLGILSNEELRLWKYRGHTSSAQWPSASEPFHHDHPGCPWSPRCFAIFDGPSESLVALCGQYNEQSTQRAHIHLYRVLINNTAGSFAIRPHMFRHFEIGHRDPLKNETVKAVNFSPDGRFLLCITRSNRVLSWDLSNNVDTQDPFIVARKYAVELGCQGVTSASIFRRSDRPYLFATTWPSSERRFNNGEWSYMSPVASSRCDVPKSIQYDITDLKKVEHILCGCASPNGDMLAILERSGKIHVLFLGPQAGGGLRCIRRVELKQALHRQERPSIQSLRFRPWGRQLQLHAIDVKGRIVVQQFDPPPDIHS